MAADFTLAGYRTLLENLLGAGYDVRGYANADPAARHLILRHDLDMSLQAAEPVAQIEAELGVKGHYFVLLRTEMYNPFSGAARESLDAIRGHGHAVGLHLDASLYPDDPAALDDAAARECVALEAATGAPVEVISFHRPAKALVGYERPLAERRHAYEPRFVEDMGYVSDSRGAWHHGHPLEHPAVAGGWGLQLLTHPVWWAQEHADATTRARNFHAARCDLLDRELARNCSVHQPRSEGARQE